MSRFDRRLKGVGLRPGQSTCNLRNSQPPMLSNRTRNYAPVNNFSNSAVVPNAPMVQNNTVVPQPQNNLMTEDELALKTRQLEQYSLTAPTQALKLITGHEIRLNKLEWINGMCEKMCKEEEEQLTNNVITPGASVNEIDMKNYYTENKLKLYLHCWKERELDPLLKAPTVIKDESITEKRVTEVAVKVYEIRESKRPDYNAQINALAKTLSNSIRDVGVLKQQIAIVGPQLTKLTGLIQEIDGLKNENKLLKEDISNLRMESAEKSGEIIKLNTEELEKKVSKEVSEEVIKEVVQDAIKKKTKKKHISNAT
jgi:hypothetical protein|uniref:Uncharacterized protein n=1 Tax=viral metagenome TaxID=1070528 RepID=A0A6C0IPH4_9ZZZZ